MANGTAPPLAPPIVHEVLQSPGQPLDAATRSFMEPRFRQDLTAVRIHTDERASQSARAVSALAYTAGSNIVFKSGQYVPGTARGNELLAHELTHAVAQRSTSYRAGQPLSIGPASDNYERQAEHVGRQIATPTFGATSAPLGVLSQAGTQRLQRAPETLELASGAYVGDLAGAGDNLREDVLTILERLLILWAITNVDYSAEQPTVAALPAGSTVPQATIPKTILALKQAKDPTLPVPVAGNVFGLPLTGSVGAGATNAKADILQLQDQLHGYGKLGDAGYNTEHTAVSADPSPNIADKSIPETIKAIPLMKVAFVGGDIRRDLLAGTQAVTPTQHVEVEHILNPTTTVVPAPAKGPPMAPPTIKQPPALTGAGPGGDFEKEILAYLQKNLGTWAKNFNALKAKAGQPAFPIGNANNIAMAAQAEVEHYFGPYIKTAGRGAADKYHPETYSLIAKLGDESTRPLNDASRRGWLGYFESLRAPNCASATCAQEILDARHFSGSRDSAELDRITAVYLSSAANVQDLDDTIHGWSAEAGSGTVFIQPYQAATTPKQQRESRWELFTTLIHEMMHIVTHPNYAAAADAIGGTGRKILIEGFAEIMRTELWSGAGRLSSRVANAEMAPLRNQVEGSALPFDATAVKDGAYYGQLADATQIDSKVGHENAKAAFFLGQVELLGLGAGTFTQGAKPLTGIAAYAATDSKDADIVVAQAGDTLASLQARTGAAPGGLQDEGTGTALAAGAAIAAGQRVKVPGIRWVAAVKNNTFGSVAEQNHVSVDALAQANLLPVGTAAATPVVPPQRILIPIHRDLP